MYDACFGLNWRPFGSVPQIDRYFATAAIEGARTTLVRCIQRGEGAGLVIGPSGTGKTLLCLLLAEKFKRSVQVVLLVSGRLSTRRALFQAILYELGRPYRGMDEGELRLAVVDHLMAGQDSPHGMLLLVDEAHTLPFRLLDEIRLLTNLARSDQPLVRLVLAGGPVLEERFASPKLDSFSQRLAARCYLEALNRTDTKDYIQWQLSAAGGQGDWIFPEQACHSVFQATGGVPRLINQVCDHALLLAYVAGRKTIEPANVEEAWADLQQLPTPWTDGAKSDQAGSGVIEFGSLDDQADGAPSPSDAVKASAPVLRISLPAEEAETDCSEPGQQIHRIERLLAQVGDDFQPAGSIGPEVELCFQRAAHPFQEEFEHEEVVADRYAAMAMAAATPIAEPASERLPGSKYHGERPPHCNEGALGDDGHLLERSLQPEPEREPEPALVSAPPRAPHPEPFVTEDRQEKCPPTQATDDLREKSPPTPSSPVAPVRRHEYRQLFARLRRG